MVDYSGMKICFFSKDRCPLEYDHEVHVVYFDQIGRRRSEPMGKYDQVNVLDMSPEYGKMWKRNLSGEIHAVGLAVKPLSAGFEYEPMLKDIGEKVRGINESIEHLRSINRDIESYGLANDPLLTTLSENRRKIAGFVSRQRFLQDLFDGLYNQARAASAAAIEA